jgi:hypothetical protein
VKKQQAEGGSSRLPAISLHEFKPEKDKTNMEAIRQALLETTLKLA